MKNKKNKIYLAFGIVIVLLLAVFLGFRIVKTNIFKSKITHVSEKLIKTQDSLINNQKIFNRLHVVLDATIIAATYLFAWFLKLNQKIFDIGICHSHIHYSMRC